MKITLFVDNPLLKRTPMRYVLLPGGNTGAGEARNDGRGGTNNQNQKPDPFVMDVVCVKRTRLKHSKLLKISILQQWSSCALLPIRNGWGLTQYAGRRLGPHPFGRAPTPLDESSVLAF